ncbi:pyridoxal phosphate-dependent aminotransferase [Micromonospora fluostatini]|uniref:pyridoxal phosphate-dependent aminotransferase n=1 Tax=Micromonospora sp. JCM 30529 TaxID=3421643 RepID=UPI003D16622A
MAGRFGQVGSSPTYELFDRVRSMRGRGVEVLDLASGEPLFDSPAHVVTAAVAALEAGRTRYAPSRGLPELLEAISAKLKDENAVVTDPATDIVVTPSAKHGLFVALAAVLDPGDEVLIPTPGWVSYAAMARLLGAVPVQVPMAPEDGFRLSRSRLAAAVTSRTRALVVNTPHNPTGHVLDEAEAEEIAGFVHDHDLVVITDEIYEKINFGARPHLSMASVPGCADRTLTVNGFSKSYAMPGWRLGFVAGPADIVAAVLAVHQHTVGSAGTFVQHGGVAALGGPQRAVSDMTAEYAEHARLTVGALAAIPGVTCPAPEGTFYAFPDIRGTGWSNSVDFARWLLEETAVAVTPGSVFGAGGEGHVRVAFSAPSAVLTEALRRWRSAAPSACPRSEA